MTNHTDETTIELPFNITISLPKDEHVQSSEHRLWRFLLLHHGSLCKDFGFEERPYWMLFLQSIASTVVLLVFKAVAQACSTKKSAVEPDDYVEVGQTPDFQHFDIVSASVAFESSGTPPFTVEAGMTGVVLKYGQNGECLIHFRGHGAKWISKNNFAKLVTDAPPKRWKIEEESGARKVYDKPSVDAAVIASVAGGSIIAASDQGDWLKVVGVSGYCPDGLLVGQSGFVLGEGFFCLADKAYQETQQLVESWEQSGGMPCGAITPLMEANEKDDEISGLIGNFWVAELVNIESGNVDQTQQVHASDIGEMLYFAWQGSMALYQLLSIIWVVFTRASHERASMWAKLNLVVYAFFNSGASLFLGQVAAKNLTTSTERKAENRVSLAKDNITHCLEVAAWSTPAFTIIIFAFANTTMMWLCASSSIGNVMRSVFQQLLANILMAFAGLVVLFFLIQPIKGAVTRLEDPERAAKLPHLKTLKPFFSVYVVFLYQMIVTMVLVQVRINAGEFEGSFFDPVYNDFMARTWYSIAACTGAKSAKKADRLFDIVQSWT